MRIEEQVIVDAPAKRVWELVADPVDLPRFMPGITRLDAQGSDAPAAAWARATGCSCARARPMWAG